MRKPQVNNLNYCRPRGHACRYLQFNKDCKNVPKVKSIYPFCGGSIYIYAYNDVYYTQIVHTQLRYVMRKHSPKGFTKWIPCTSTGIEKQEL